MSRKRRDSWTRDEDKFLVAHYRRRGRKWCADRLPNRTEDAVKTHARWLGLTDPRRPPRPTVTKPQCEHNPNRAKRRCLKCDRKFWSDHIGNRICKTCAPRLARVSPFALDIDPGRRPERVPALRPQA